MGPSTTTSHPPSVFPMPLFVFLFLTFTTLRELAKLFAEPSNKELSSPVTKSDLSHATSRVRRFSPLNNTRKYSSLLGQVTPLVSLSRVLPRMRRFLPETSSTTKRTVSSSQSRASLRSLLCKSTPVFSSLVTALWFSLVPPRLH